MPRIVVETVMDACPEHCFDLARNVRIHEQTTGSTKEKVLDLRNAEGQTPDRDLLELGDEVTFEAVHFGGRQRLTSKIVSFDRPHEFTDEMQKGAFKSLRHIHRFEPQGSGTRMIDILDFESPAWIFGSIANAVFLTRYMARFLISRGEALKQIAEG